MVKIRLRRMGTKGAPFYRIVVAKSTAGRNGAFIETIGTYNPVAQPKHLAIKNDRALHWLVEGAQPSETVAYLLKKVGVLDEYFDKRPKAKANFKYLDKRTSAISVKSAIAAPSAEKEAPAKAEAAAPVEEVAEAPVEAVAEAPVEAAAEETTEAPAESAE